MSGFGSVDLGSWQRVTDRVSMVILMENLWITFWRAEDWER